MTANGISQSSLGTSEYRTTFRPFTQARDAWVNLVASSQESSLYHNERWIELLSRVYRLRIMVAQTCGSDGAQAACLFATSRNPLRRGIVALPFSDSCVPLGARDVCAALIAEIASMQPQLGSVEIRGIAAGYPWITLDHFGLWTLRLHATRAVQERGFKENFRRNVKKARRHGFAVDHGHDANIIRRFYRLNLESRRRLGLPSPPLRFFNMVAELFGAEADVWIASDRGRDLAGIFLLSGGSRLYYKWSARANGELHGANHLLLRNIIEAYADRFEYLDFGRADWRNSGLIRFKQETGASVTPLPSSFLPCAPRFSSAEHLDGSAALLSRIWRLLPLSVARVIGGAIYGYLT